MEFIISENSQKVVIGIPCLNEEIAIQNVVMDCKQYFPEARIVVFDNESNDKTSHEAHLAGAEVIHSPMRGKGQVIKHFFREIEADVYILLDGDGTYPANQMRLLLDEFKRTGADMVIGNRISHYQAGSFPKFHYLGNKLFTVLISHLFGHNIPDVLSGARILRQRFVSALYLRYNGFEVEIEITIQAIIKNMSIVSIPITYRERPRNSKSKLRTWEDGLKILKALINLFKEHRPMGFYGLLSAIFAAGSVSAGIFPIYDYYMYQFVFHVPLAILAAAFGILSIVSFFLGSILSNLYHYHMESVEKNNKNKSK